MTGLYASLCMRQETIRKRIYTLSVAMRDTPLPNRKKAYASVIKLLERKLDLLNYQVFCVAEELAKMNDKAV